MEGKDSDESLLKVKSHFTVTRYKRTKKHTEYTFNVYDIYGTLIHTVEKRYSHFYSFHNQLSKLSTITVSETLPPKTMWKNCVDVVQQRKYAFENYLNSLLLKNPIPHKDLIYSLSKFLNVKEELVYRLFSKNLSMYCGLKSSYKCSGEDYEIEFFNAVDCVYRTPVLLKKFTGSCALKKVSQELSVLRAFKGKFRGLGGVECFEDLSTRSNNSRSIYVSYSHVNGSSLATFRDRLLSDAKTVTELEGISKKIANMLLDVVSKLHSLGLALLDMNVDTIYFISDGTENIAPVSYHLCQAIPKNSEEIAEIRAQAGLSHQSFRHPVLQLVLSGEDSVAFEQDSVALDRDSLQRCDVWSVGTIVYYFAVGRDPFIQEPGTLYSKLEPSYATKKKAFSFHYNPLLSKCCKDWISRVYTEDLNCDSNYLESLCTHIWLNA